MKKMLVTSLAALGVAGMIGGGTFASWSDFALLDTQEAGAGHLILDVGDFTDSSVDKLKLAPGENRYQVFQVASNDGDSVPDGQLYITLSNITDFEDGCTSNGEAVAEGADPYAGGYDEATDCGGPNDGEFSDQGRLWIYQYGPSSNGQCSNVAPDPSVVSTLVVNGQWLGDQEGVKHAVVELEPGQQTCVGMRVLLVGSGPAAATNAVMGDSAEWDVRFDLEQV